MTTPSQLKAVQKKIDDLESELLNTKKALAAAQSTPEIDFLEQLLALLEQLNKTQNLLQEKENVLLQGQASGEHCLSCCQLLSRSCVACTMALYVIF